MTIMLLKKLINNCPNNLNKVKVRGLSSDTRTLKKGELFFALDGEKYNGSNFIDKALKKGAAAIVTKKKFNNYRNIIYKRNVLKELVFACNQYYKNKPKNIIAVTGTNGKSSVADFFYQILKLNSVKAATIGTLGIRKGNNLKKTNLTSLDLINFHKELEKIKKLNINNVLVEASSHGLEQGRLNGINYLGGIFTNLSQDHLDYHKSMKNYFNSKLILFKKLIKSNKYLITDKNIPEIKVLKKIAKEKHLNLKTIDLEKDLKKLNRFNLIGDFQKKNLLMAIEACQIIGLNKNKIYKQLFKIHNVKGRLDLTRVLPNGSKVFIDFAHTPNAIENAISSLSAHFQKKITIIFGCGGQRDKKKRKLMGKIANSLCNKIYITDDNPRNENPKKIRQSILKFIDSKKAIEIGDRSKAIYHSLINSNPNEIILVAGKGHEALQDYGKKTIEVSDYQIVKNVKIKGKKISIKNLDFLENRKTINNLLRKNIKKGYLGVSINSKNVKKNNIFVAIKGKNNDGHNFLKEALKKGAKYCIVSKNYKNRSNNKLITVEDTKKFLNRLAILKRLNSRANIIAITGSSGKTTIKDLTGKLLNKFGKTFYSQRSYNNHYGVPLSLCNLEESHKFGVFEIGMNKSGEINSLSNLVKPNIGVITNVAEAHIENFKNVRKIAEAKSEIINNISKKGSLIINRDGKFYEYFKKKAIKKNIKVFSFGLNKNADVYPIKIEKNLDRIFLHARVFKNTYRLSFRGHYVVNILNILTILAVMNLDIKKIYGELKKISLVEGRGKIYKVKHKKKFFNFIDESYNANPLSMKESINRLSNLNIKKFKKYILLGDMLELGKKSNSLHQNLSKVINKSSIDKLFVHGKDIMTTYKFVKKSKQGNILQEKADFYEALIPIIKKNDFLMIKGSNATGLHKISKKILKGKNNVI